MTIHEPLPKPVATTCPYCGVGCGVIAGAGGDGRVAIAGDPSHPANRGKLCVKGSTLGETLSLEGRLLHPMMRTRTGTLERVSWEAALDAVAEGFRRAIAAGGPDASAFYLSGQLLTEDYYAANKLMKGFVGTANVDTNSRLCMASSVAGHRRAFGSDTVPGAYEDLDEADLLVLVGSNAAWCHPILWQRMVAAQRERGARIIVIDPRRTATAAEADLVLQIRPGTDTALFAGLLVHLADGGATDAGYIADHTTGLDEALARAREIAPTLAATAAATGLAPEDLATFFAWFTETARTVTLYSQGVNQSAQGTDKVSAILNCHLATGRIGRPGMGPFSLTGQPNAMGGREVGGLANMLAAHMGFSASEVDRVRRFWGAPRMAEREGLKAVQMFDAVAAGAIRAMWVMGTNPAASMPRADAVRAALGKLDLLVVSDNVLSNDTIQSGAHILLPAAAWGEKDGTVTNSERRISRQRAFLSLPGEARPDWWIIAEVAKRLGFAEAFAWPNAAAVFREHAALSSFENRGTRDFDIGGIACVSDAQYDELSPVQWPVRNHTDRGLKRFFAGGGFYTADGRARLVAVAPPALKDLPDADRPFLLNTGRTRDQWHTMTRTGKAPTLGRHAPEPTLAMNPADAADAGLIDGAMIRVATAHGEAVLRLALDPGQRRGEIFAPIHWTGETAPAARVGALVQAATDPFSGQPELKATAASLHPVQVTTEGFLLARARPAADPRLLWTRVTVEGGEALLFASPEALDGPGFIRRLAGDGITVTEVSDPARGIYRAAAFRGDRLEAVCFLGPGARPAYPVVAGLFPKDVPDAATRKALLAGRSADGLPDPGPTVCACFSVGLNAVKDAIAAGAADVDAVGKTTRAGTNCGSCRSEISRILLDATRLETA